MSGHSKWSTIKRKKAATDAKRGKIFSKLAREIMIAARDGGGDPAANPSLRQVIQKARAANMPMENIERAIKKGTGKIECAQFQEVVYEGYAAGGVGVIVEALTDNRNRTTADVRQVFNRFHASLSGQGSVARMFHRRGCITVPADAADEDRLLEIAVQSGADDVRREDGNFEIWTSPETFSAVVDAVQAAGIPLLSCEVTLVPELYIPVSDPAQARALVQFFEALEDLDDVKSVYSNADIADELVAQLSEQQGG
ncbi:MAG TPA: YebC/PmpR family DNA-binding transcriptional regulator [Lentisphaerae bacterium]|nr:YebC/PmpR family DNA-binding transcriptional regulator [Lentisphaerota bacterium]